MKHSKKLLMLSTLLALGACNQSLKPSSQESVKLSVSLVDAPIGDITNVYVSIERIEMLTRSGGKSKKLIFGEKVGKVDLLTLQDGVFLPVTELNLPVNTEVRNLRLILKNSGHSIVNKDGSICNLQTPSAEQSGLKMILKDIVLEGGHDYKMVVDFDAAKSVVLPGDGGCILKPVVKVKSLLKLDAPEPEPAPSPSLEVPEEIIESEQSGEELIDPLEPQNPQTPAEEDFFDEEI